jgi:two-component system response regulator AtoC
MADILVVDDDQSIAVAFRAFLEEDRHRVRVAGSAADGLRQIAERTPDLVIMDVRMPGVDGLQALQQIRARFPDLYVVIMTAYGTSQTSIEAIRSGAFDYVTKPLDLDELRVVIDKALAAQRISPMAEASAQASTEETLVNLVGQTPVMLDLYKVMARLTTNDVPALISGERGTGKQLVAETIHDNSARRDEPFAALDCGMLTESAIAEIFDGDAGTILLADVEAMPAAVQARLARALGGQGRSASTAPRLRARVLASTVVDLSKATRDGGFNRELFDVLSVIRIHLPPLRERRPDIPILVGHLIKRFNAELNRSIRGVDARVTQLLHDHAWPGNVRQLQSVVKRACVLARGDVITQDEVGDSLSLLTLPQRAEADPGLRAAVTKALHDRLLALEPSLASSAFHEIVDLVEETLVKEALTVTNGNQVKASEMLGVNRATLRKKMP